MVSRIKKSVEQHLGIPVESLSVSCFYHGAANPDRKILFLVCDGVRPVCMVKMMWDSRYDAQLRHECEAQKKAASLLTLMRVPEVLFEDTIDGRALYVEAVAPGAPVGKQRALDYLTLISRQQNLIEKGELFSLLHVATLLGIITEGLDEIPVHHAWSHGDLTYANVIDGREGPFIIDWERFNERPIWGIDLIHYLVRVFDIKDVDGLQRALHLTRLPIEADESYLIAVYKADVFLEKLDKTRHAEYERLVSKFGEF